MSAVDSLLGPVTFLMNFQADFHCNLCIFFLVELEPENLLLPTDSLATVIKISMSCLADSDCSKQVANLSMITLLRAPICLAVFVTMKVPTTVCKMSAESESSDMRFFSPEGLLAF